MITQLNPPLPISTPKGKGLAHLIIDYGPESDIHWVCFLDDNGECWTFSNKEIRAQKNITLGREYISPFYEPEDVKLHDLPPIPLPLTREEREAALPLTSEDQILHQNFNSSRPSNTLTFHGPFWRDINEELPVLSEQVLVIATGNEDLIYDNCVIKSALYREGSFYCIVWGWKLQVTHWMPIPPSPKESI